MDVLAVAAPGDPFGVGIPFLARNKRSMTLNLKSAEGRDVLLRLVDRADVLLEGFRPGVMARLGLGWETLRARNPRLVYCAISGYGQDGPYRDRVGHDVNYLAYAGVLEYGGAPDGPPAIPGVQIADVGAGGLMAAVGVLTALIARGKTGAGQMVDVAMLDGAVAWNVYHTLLYLLSGTPPVRGRTPLTGHHPCYAVYETADRRHVTVGAFEPHFWETLCRHFGREDFIPDQWDEGPRRDEMFAFFQRTFRSKPLADWRAELADVPFCFAPVNTVIEALADPQVRHRGMVVDGPDGTPTLGTPIKLSATPASIRTPPPPFGAHTDTVLAELGFSPADVARFHELRAV